MSRQTIRHLLFAARINAKYTNTALRCFKRRQSPSIRVAALV
jgi:hypothetical protein